MTKNTSRLNELLPFAFITIVFLFFSTSSFSQYIIKGKVADESGKLLAGATVSEKNTNKSTIAKEDGEFTLNVSGTNASLIVSYVGYQTAEIEVNNRLYINVTLTAVISNLDQVVVVGYGTAKKKDLTGAVTRVTAKELNSEGVITSPMQQLEGKVAGLVIVEPGGDPNGDFVVRLRGATSLEGQPPLLVIDGVAIDDFFKSITTLNPADIESFDILKDASASAIYGSRGANGVIIVTTKKAKIGKTLIDYNGFLGAEKISNEIKVLSADQWRKATGDSSGLDKGANTDWQKAISQTGISHSHTIGISGGTDELNFRGSASYLKQEGVIINTGKEVITGRLNANQKSFKNRLEINYGINTSIINRDFLPDQASTSQVRNGGSSLFYFSLAELPVVPVYNPDGSFYQGDDLSVQTPVNVLKQVSSKKRENFFQGSAKANYELIPGLKIGGLIATARANDVYDFFRPAVPATNQKSVATKSNDNKQTFSGDIHGSYVKRSGKHSINITGVYEYNRFINDGFSVTASGYLIPELLDNNMSAATQVLTTDIPSYKNEVKLISFLGRAVYNFDDRYIMTINFRRDGSSKFGPEHHWGNFPSISAAWRPSSEFILKDVEWINNIKFRISYGLTGNQENLAPYPYQLLYGSVGPYLYAGSFLQSYGIVQQDNPGLKWEVRKSFNVGFDFSVLSDRINGTIDVFSDKTSDMLFQYDLPQPPFLYNKVTANAANAINKGVEIMINAGIIRNKKFRWDASVNFATIRNRLTNLAGQFEGTSLALSDAEQHYGYAQGNGYSGAYISQLKVGYPAGVFWIPQHAGINASGLELYNNYDAAGKLIGTSPTYSDQDRVFIDPTPHYNWGLTNTFSFKNLDLNIFIRGVQGQKVFANTLMAFGAIGYLPGTNITQKALTSGFANQPQPSTYWLKDGSYTRLENITLGYSFKNIKGISSFRMYISVSNLFIITKYEGIDPEINTDGSQRYIDNNYYPKTRGFIFGASMTL